MRSSHYLRHLLPTELANNCMVPAVIIPTFWHEIAMLKQLRAVFLQEENWIDFVPVLCGPMWI
jgi:hypothetical protein